MYSIHCFIAIINQVIEIHWCSPYFAVTVVTALTLTRSWKCISLTVRVLFFLFLSPLTCALCIAHVIQIVPAAIFPRADSHDCFSSLKSKVLISTAAHII